MTQLTLLNLKIAAAQFVKAISGMPIPDLFGSTDGKAVGAYVEQAFNHYLRATYNYIPGNAALGIDFPDLNVDLKVTSIRQPQSSCPYRDASQKVYGLGYHLLVSINFKALLNCIQLEKLIMQASVEYQSYKPNSDIVNLEWHSSLELLSR
ncbi:hypothetical protein [Fischerella thermalis]|jgi:hypothetical protein|uniref:hypothetical protein n=1 Tax=Fischerella thermalis TaxID=372787 RepID=UPI001CA5465A|nr:hypothetical protein [Fischerella thermalis]